MRTQNFIRPLGMLYGPCADDAVTRGQAARLAGGDIAFSICQTMERGPGGTARHGFVCAGDLPKNGGGDWYEAFNQITMPRPAFAGLSMDRSRIMGIVNVTPDSFSDGGQFATAQEAIDHGLRLEDNGAGILDIGGESTRPNANTVSVDDELARVLPVLEGLSGRTDARLSIDTRKPQVMQRAAEAGAHIINDVSALTYDPDSLHIAAETGLPVILMHSQGSPQTMQDNPHYENVLLDVFDYLAWRIEAAEAVGIARSNLMADPGIGFGKTLGHNLELLAGLSLFHGLGVPLLLGASRKRFIGEIADKSEPQDRMPGSLAAALNGVAQGVQVVRVHDVAETQQALQIWHASVSGQ